MSRERSESLLGAPAPTTQQQQKSSAENQTLPASRADYLFRNEKKAGEDQVARELRAVFEARAHQANQAREISGAHNDGKLTPDEHADREALDRMNERNRRHRTADGDIVVWCRVRSGGPELALDVRALVVPADPKRPVPDFSGDDCFLVRAVFRQPTMLEHRRLEPLLSCAPEKNEEERRFDHAQHHLQLFRMCFKEWNISVKLPSDNGRLTDDAMKTLESLVHPRVIEEIGDALFELVEPTDFEIKQLRSQCGRMFAKNSRGVKFACEGIRAYCDHASMKDLSLVADSGCVSWRTHLLMTIVVQQKNEAEQKEMEESERKNRPRSAPHGVRR